MTDPTPRLLLTQETPFASGGNRLCFVHPQDPSICVKVAHPDVSLAEKRKRKGLKGKLKPAVAFDENRSEQRTLETLIKQIGPALHHHVPAYHGMIDTDLGLGIQVGLVRCTDGTIARTLKQRVWEDGVVPALSTALETFAAYWIQHRIPSRALLLHNLVVEERPTGLHLWVIDGLGSSDLLPLSRWSPRLAQRKAQRKIADLYERIDTLLMIKERGGNPGRHGFLPKAATSELNNPTARG
ncbi:MAG: YrbL family protein [Pseudomonadota bacterium]